MRLVDGLGNRSEKRERGGWNRDDAVGLAGANDRAADGVGDDVPHRWELVLFARVLGGCELHDDVPRVCPGGSGESVVERFVVGEPHVVEEVPTTPGIAAGHVCQHPFVLRNRTVQCRQVALGTAIVAAVAAWVAADLASPVLVFAGVALLTGYFLDDRQGAPQDVAPCCEDDVCDNGSDDVPYWPPLLPLPEPHPGFGGWRSSIRPR